MTSLAGYGRRAAALSGLVATLGLAASAALAASNTASKSGGAEAGLTIVGGTLKIELELSAGAAVPDGTVISVSQSANVSEIQGSSNSSIYTSVTVKNRKVQAKLILPYKWAVASTDSQIAVFVSLDGSYLTGYASTYFTKRLPLPKNGASTVVRFTGGI